MQFARRQWQLYSSYILLWALLSVVCAIAGPFGTHDAMGLVGRLAYWSIVVSVSIAGSVSVARIEPAGQVQRISVWAGYAVALGSAIFGFNALLFNRGAVGVDLISLIAIVLSSVLAINALIYLGRQMTGAGSIPPQNPPDTQGRFLRRLPIETRGAMVRIEAQDHYLNVVTIKGSALILLRMAEAMEELGGAGGVQTHRSHWIALDAVQGHCRTKGRDVLQMSDGSSVPVARTRRDAARAAGLF